MDADSQFPFYVSYQDPETICFTRENDEKQGIVRISDTFALVFLLVVLMGVVVCVVVMK